MGTEVERFEEDLNNKSPLLLKLNPVHKKVPVLLHGDKAIAESIIILDYIDETWKHNLLLPQNRFERAIARFWAKFNDDKCVSGAWNASCLEGEEKEKVIESTKESFAFLEKQLEGKKFFSGESIGYLDLVAGWIPDGISAMEEVGGMKLLDQKDFPLIHEWSNNILQAPIIKETLSPRQKLLDYFQAGVDHTRSLAAATL